MCARAMKTETPAGRSDAGEGRADIRHNTHHEQTTSMRVPLRRLAASCASYRSCLPNKHATSRARACVLSYCHSRVLLDTNAKQEMHESTWFFTPIFLDVSAIARRRSLIRRRSSFVRDESGTIAEWLCGRKNDSANGNQARSATQ